MSGFDVFRIAQGLRLAPEQFVLAIAVDEPTAYSFQVAGTQQTYELALDKVNPRLKEDQPCVFWLPVGSRAGRCGIYPYRPFACRVYPAVPDEHDVMVRRDDVICPAGAWLDGTLTAPIWKREYRRMQVESDIYQLVVMRWNYHFDRTPDPGQLGLPTYLAYVVALYGRLYPVLTSLNEAEWDALSGPWTDYLADGESPLLGDVPPPLTPWNDFFWSLYNTTAAAFEDGFGFG